MNKINTTNSTYSEFLGYIHSFRGLAILKIVLGHAVAAACIATYGVFDVSYPVLMVSEIFYHDSTIYFAIISGLLFSKVLKTKGYLRFYKSKLKNIVLPYVFFTLVLTLLKMHFEGFSSFQDGLVFYLSKVWVNFIYGKANFALWYIPVLIFLYLVTPVLDLLQNTNKYTKAVFFLIIMAPLFISRIQLVTQYDLRMETMMYFTGAYALGMSLGSDLNEKLRLMKVYKRPILLLVLISTLVLFYFYKNQIDKIGGVSLKETVFYIQKIGFAFVFILMFKNLELKQKQVNWLHPVARDSFSIYFIHGTILYTLSPFLKFLFETKNTEPFNVIFGALILFIMATLVCMLIVALFRKVFGKNSRMIVGS